MSAQIITGADFAGRHNANLEHSATRVLKGATWKKQRIIVMLPAGATIPTKVALTHWNLIFPPNNHVFRMLCEGLEVGEAYTTGIEAVLSHPELSTWEYLLTIEHDNMPPPDGILKLIETMDAHPEYCCIGGLYWTKGEGGVPQLWGDPKDPVLNFRPQVPIPNTVQECCGTGMGFNLWRLATFKDEKLRKPWFKTLTGLVRDGDGQHGRGMCTQDLYFWMDARKHGYRCAVNTGVLVGHYCSDTDMVW